MEKLIKNFIRNGSILLSILIFIFASNINAQDGKELIYGLFVIEPDSGQVPTIPPGGDNILPPTSFVTVGDSNKITMSWNTAEPEADFVKIYRGALGSPLSFIALVPVPITSYTDSNLVGTYVYAVSHLTDYGLESAFSNRDTAQSTIVSSTLSAPTNLTATVLYSGSKINWICNNYGVNKVSNGTFDTDYQGWIVNPNTTASIENSMLKIARNGALYPGAYQIVDGLTPGESYRFSYTYKKGTSEGQSSNLGTTMWGYEYKLFVFPNDSTVSFDFVATNDTAYVLPQLYTTVDGRYGYFDDFSIRGLSNTAFAKTIIEKSSDGISFSVYDSVDAYVVEYLDQAQITDTVYYRLREKDIFGGYSRYSNIVMAAPNPALTLTPPYAVTTTATGDIINISWQSDFPGVNHDLYVGNDSLTMSLLTTTQNLYYNHNVGWNTRKYYKLRSWLGTDTTAFTFCVTDSTGDNNTSLPLVMEPNSGSYDYATFVNLTSSIPGADIYYTLDNSTPDLNDAVYYKPIQINSTTTVKAMAYLAGVGQSSIISKTYTINPKQSGFEISGNNTFIEAEATTSNTGHTMLRPDRERASNGVYTLITDDQDGQNKFILQPQSSGNYDIWLRVSSLGIVYAGITVNFNGVDYNTTASPTSNGLNGWQWHWINPISNVSLTAGQNYTLYIEPLYSSSEPAQIDRILVTNQLSYTPPSITLLRPNGGERWIPDSTYDISWTSDGNLTNVKIEYSSDAGSSWNIIASSTANDGSYSWTAPSIQGKYKFKITSADGDNAFDMSDGFLTVTNTIDYYSHSKTFGGEIYHSLDHYYSFSTEQDYLNYMTAQGAKNTVGCLNAHIGFYDSGTQKWSPHTAGLSAYRTADATSPDSGKAEIVNYGNYQTISWNGTAASATEGVMLNMNEVSNWQMLKTDGTPYISPTGGTRYGINFANPDVIQKFVDGAIAYRNAGADGFYWDSFSVLQKKTGENDEWTDAGGAVQIRNPETGLAYTTAEYFDHLQKMVYEVQKKTDRYYGIKDNVHLWVNGIGYEQYIEFQDYLDGYFGETWMGGQEYSSWWSWNMFELFLNDVLFLNAKDKLAWVGNAVNISSNFITDLTDNQEIMFYVASLLLAVNDPEDEIANRTQALPVNSWSGYGNLQRARFVPLGRYEEISSELYKREFIGATVYVNASQSPKNVTFPASYYLQDDGTWSSSTVTSRSIPACGGLIIDDESTFTGYAQGGGGGGSSTVTVTGTIQAGSDDGHIYMDTVPYGGYLDYDGIGSGTRVGYASGGYWEPNWLFTLSSQVPSNAIIDSAKLYVTFSGVSTSTPVNATGKIADSASPSAITDSDEAGYQAVSFVGTTVTISDMVGGSTGNTVKLTEDFGPMVQALITSQGAVSSLMLRLAVVGTSTGIRYMYAYESDPTKTPEFKIYYHLP